MVERQQAPRVAARSVLVALAALAAAALVAAVLLRTQAPSRETTRIDRVQATHVRESDSVASPSPAPGEDHHGDYMPAGEGYHDDYEAAGEEEPLDPATCGGGCHGASAEPLLPPDREYETSYGSLFAPSQIRTVGDVFLSETALGGSASCGTAGCHPDITRQWESSTHRHAGTNPYYRYAVDRMAEDYGIAATRLCVGCHEPGVLAAGLVDANAVPNLALRAEGVSCLACHAVVAVHDAPGKGQPANASLTFDPAFSVALGDASKPPDELQLGLHATALDKNDDLIRSNRFCAACHQFYIPPGLGGRRPQRLRLQEAEAAGTHFGDPSHPDHVSCVDCHMPRAPADDGSDIEDGTDVPGELHDHRALGSNVFLPALAGDQEQVDAVMAFRKEGEPLTMSIDGWQWDAGGKRLDLLATVKNRAIGHDFPTGATDIIETWGELSLTDARGVTVFRSPGLDERGYLHKDAPSLNTVVLLPGGDADYLHDLFSHIALVQHPRVNFGGSQRLEFSVTLPSEAEPPFRASVTLRIRRGNQRWNDWGFNWEEVEVPVADLLTVERALGPPPAPPTRPAVDDEVPTAPDGMVWVPAGTYPIGKNDGEPDAAPEETPLHEVELEGFFIDATPVTNARWQEVMARKYRSRLSAVDKELSKHSWVDGRPPAGREQHPVVLVTQPEAREFCRAAGGRLPSEAEWEAAAAGSRGARHAWGEDFDPARCNTIEAGIRDILPVGSRPRNASPFGALDMGCNVAEWVEDSYRAYPRTRHGDNREEPFELFSEDLAVIRGASYLMPGLLGEHLEVALDALEAGRRREGAAAGSSRNRLPRSPEGPIRCHESHRECHFGTPLPPEATTTPRILAHSDLGTPFASHRQRRGEAPCPTGVPNTGPGTPKTAPSSASCASTCLTSFGGSRPTPKGASPPLSSSSSALCCLAAISSEVSRASSARNVVLLSWCHSHASPGSALPARPVGCRSRQPTWSIASSQAMFPTGSG